MISSRESSLEQSAPVRLVKIRFRQTADPRGNDYDVRRVGAREQATQSVLRTFQLCHLCSLKLDRRRAGQCLFSGGISLFCCIETLHQLSDDLLTDRK